MIRPLLLLCLTLLSSTAPPTCLTVDQKVYKVCYSEKLENPVSVDYIVYRYKKGVDRGSTDFHGEPNVKTADNNDFFDNVYDKGHLAPAETFSDTQKHLDLTFSYLNCALQHYKLNRGLWAILERRERDWSQQDSVIVHVDVLFDEPVKRVKGGAAIPDWFVKKVTLKKSKITYVYKFPNKDTSGKKLDSFLVKRR